MTDRRQASLHRSHYVEWNARTLERGRSGVPELLRELAHLGFAWWDVARLFGVSVPAVQKWRRGDHPTGQHRRMVAGLLAACDLVADHYGVQDVASWFEMPMRPDTPVTPIDLWSEGRPDLVLDYASGHTDPEDLLTTWDERWRERYQSDFETFRAGDGQLSIRPKER